MDKKIAGLIGAMTVIGAAAPGQGSVAAPLSVEAAMQVTSYADLLKPIPDAAALLQASDAQAQATLLAPAAEGDATLQTVQFYHHHHHHHHHHGFGPRFAPRFFRRQFHHHHHHHHHHHFRREEY